MLAKFAVVVSLFLAAPAQEAETADTPCKGKCWRKKLYRKARKATPREPLPACVVRHESGFQLHRPAMDGLGGGRYQIIPSTWRANPPSSRFIRIAGGDKGPIWSSRLLQDKVAWTIRKRAGLNQWVAYWRYCA